MLSVQYFWQYDPHCSSTHISLKPWHLERELHHSLCGMYYLRSHLTDEKKTFLLIITFVYPLMFSSCIYQYHLLWENAKPQR